MKRLGSLWLNYNEISCDKQISYKFLWHKKIYERKNNVHETENKYYCFVFRIVNI